jgi:hypothetical protein
MGVWWAVSAGSQKPVIYIGIIVQKNILVAKLGVFRVLRIFSGKTIKKFGLCLFYKCKWAYICTRFEREIWIGFFSKENDVLINF